ncbi:MAG: hypothetical protein MRY74_05845 [Neomegalonema sp.]|nr:hypothetical protein [Neomegalonema sp.]
MEKSANAAAPKKGRRPKWLPAEFATPQELVAAYEAARAEKDRQAVKTLHAAKTHPTAQTAAATADGLGRPQDGPKPMTPGLMTSGPLTLAPQFDAVDGPQAPAPTYPGDARSEASPPAPAAPAASPIDLAAFEREFCETGEICEASYAKLETIGAPRWLVDRHIEGRRAVAETAKREILELVGGADRFEAIKQWAEETLTGPEREAYDEALRSGKEKAKLAVLGLAAAYGREAGEPPRLVGGGDGQAEGGPFANADELANAIRDPRYRSDPTYRAEVMARLAQRRVF